MSEQMIVIDGHSLMHPGFLCPARYHDQRGGAAHQRHLRVLMMLQRIIRDENPAYLAVAFDPHGPTFRHEAFAQYKGLAQEDARRAARAVRPPAGDSAGLGYPVIVVPGYEADDVLGTCAAWCGEQGRTMLVVTGDKDTLQLISPSTQVLLTRQGHHRHGAHGRRRADADVGRLPEHVPDLKGLMGDSSRQHPRRARGGEKSRPQADGPVRRPGGRADPMWTRCRAKSCRPPLREYADQARMSRDLATIRTDAPMDFAQLQIPARAPGGQARAALCPPGLQGHDGQAGRAPVRPGG